MVYHHESQQPMYQHKQQFQSILYNQPLVDVNPYAVRTVDSVDALFVFLAVVHMMMLVDDGSIDGTTWKRPTVRVHFEYKFVHHLRLSDLP
jgi:hypothetical protein